MRSVRCEVCGTKALTAASKCPRCGHLFDVRDGFGELLPLAYCSTCDSYYPESLGLCKWCGTKPETSAISPLMWKGVGAGAVVIILIIGFLLRDKGTRHDADAQTTAEAKSKVEATSGSSGVAQASNPVDSSAPEMQLVRVDSIPRDDTIPSTNANSSSSVAPAPGPEPRPAGSSSSRVDKKTMPDKQAALDRQAALDKQAALERQAALGRQAALDKQAALDRQTELEKPAASITPRPVARATSPVRKATATAKTRTSSRRWVSSVAREWVVVRAGPSKASRLVASIGPNSRVQLGEVRGSWRRIRMRGITGWVETSSEFASVPAPMPRVLVAR